MMNDPHNPESRLLKIPALNVVHLCGVVPAQPRSACSESAAVFDLVVRTYRPGKKSSTALVTVHCYGSLADTVRARIRADTVLFVTGSLQRSHPEAILHITASVVQFLSGDK